MFNNESNAADSQHAFVFHGKASSFFIICLANFLLTIITLGIYLPWAFVKSRRYVYENMELNGVRFSYQATGGAFFISWLLLGLLSLVLVIFFGVISPALSLLPMLILMAIIPILAIKGLRYQAMMTQLNNVRFGFNCGAGKAFWTMLVLPVLLMLAVVLLISVVGGVMGTPESLNGLVIQMTIMIVLALVATGTINGIIYAKWMQLLGNNARFGIHSFRIEVSLKRCVVVGIAAMLILVPFIIVIAKLMGPLFTTIFMSISMGNMDSAASMALVTEYQMRIIVSYLLYFSALMLMFVFVMAVLRNLFINGLRLGDSLTFRSNLTFIGLLAQMLVLSLATMCTFGLAYPWAKMRYIRYLANKTTVVGNLDEVELRDTDEKNDTGFIAALSRGTMPAIPFI